MSRPLQSISGSSNNIMLKVTVPKWTGRKRKRGSDESFAYVDPASAIETSAPKRPRAKDLQRSLRDNVGKYRIEPIGRVERTHVFRGEDTSNRRHGERGIDLRQGSQTSFSPRHPVHSSRSFENAFCLSIVCPRWSGMTIYFN